MQTALELKLPGWRWQGRTAAIGQAFDADGQLLRAADLALMFDGRRDADDWRAALVRLNGSFAMVSQRDDAVLAAVDRVRSLPLFYTRDPRGMAVADTAQAIRGRLTSPEMDDSAWQEFELAGYVTGADTLCTGIRQIRAGRLLVLSTATRAGEEQTPYYDFRHRDLDRRPSDARIADLIDVHARVFARLAADLGDRPVVVPLSGGYDSRLVGVALKELGLRNVLCYTYGVPGNWESRISEELARYLGFRWTMVPYSADRWRTWSATPEFKAYFREAGNLCSVPHVQDWPAVFELKRSGQIAPDSVFVPGHSGDFLAGSHVPRSFVARATVAREEFLQAMFDTHYALWDWPVSRREALRADLAARIERVIGPLSAMTSEQAADAFECWDWQERQAKFICNSMRVYDFFGFEWRLPLFDLELMDFWSRAGVEDRVGRRLYFEFAQKHQSLPITPANADYPPLVQAAIRAGDALGLRPVGERARRLLRRVTWQKQYETSSLAWFALIDRDEFRSRYTGREIAHAFIASRYLAQFKD